VLLKETPLYYHQPTTLQASPALYFQPCPIHSTADDLHLYVACSNSCTHAGQEGPHTPRVHWLQRFSMHCNHWLPDVIDALHQLQLLGRKCLYAAFHTR
jgi:hypothetical protein